MIIGAHFIMALIIILRERFFTLKIINKKHFYFTNVYLDNLKDIECETILNLIFKQLRTTVKAGSFAVNPNQLSSLIFV